MSENISKKYYIGRTVENGKWSSVYMYKPHNPEIKDKLGQIFAVVSLSSSPEFNITTAGNLILDFFHESYFESEDDNILKSLEKSVLATSKHLQKLMQNDMAAKTGIDMDLATMVIIGDRAYFVNMGEGHILLFRDGNLTHISNHLKDPIGSKVINVGSMYLKRADVALITTSTAFDEISQDEFIDSAVEFSEIKIKNKKFEDESQVSLVLVGYSVDRKESRAEHSLHEQITTEVDIELDHLDSMPDEQEDLETEVSDNIINKKTNIPILGHNLDEEEEFNEPNVEVSEETGEPKEMVDVDAPEDEEISKEDHSKSDTSKSEPGRFTELRGKFQTAILNLKARFKKKSINVETAEHTPILHMESENSVNSRFQHNETAETEKSFEKNKPTYLVIIRKIKNSLLVLFQNVKALVWDNWLGMGSKDLFVKGSKIKRTANIKLLIILSIVIICLLYFSFKGIKNGIEKNKIEEDFRGKSEQAQQLVTEVGDLATIKAKSPYSDPTKQELFTKLTDAEALFNSIQEHDLFASDAEAGLKKISDYRDTLNQIIAVNPTQLVDFGASYPASETADMVAGKEFIYAIDKKYGKVYQVSPEGVAKEIVSGLNAPRSITIDDKGNLIILDADADKGLLRVNTANNEITRFTGTSSTRVGGVTAIDFSEVSGGRVYGIDANAKQIVYLARSNDTYSFPAKRVQMDQIASALDMQIMDNKIYILMDYKQGVYRFSNDQDDTPAITGLQAGENLYGATAFFIDGLNVYVADPENQRILVFTKGQTEMSFVGQYAYRGEKENGFKNIKEIFANRVKNIMYILDGDIIYTISLDGTAP